MTPNIFNSISRFIAILVAAFALSLAGCRVRQSEISRSEIDRIITTLAADDMEGRRTFEPGIEKAAQFLVGEFERIGLEKFDGLSGYEQSFHVYSLRPATSRIVLNGSKIAPDDVFFQAGEEMVIWTGDEEINIVRVAQDGDLAETFRALRRSSENALVLVDETHRELFARYRRFFSGPRRTLDLGDGASVVYVLSTAINVDTYRVEISNEVEKLPLANIAGQITGRITDEFVLFSAHYDHVGIRSGVEPDSIFNGANDDASGTTAVVALADYFKQMGRPERTLLFVAFTAEEMGGYGSEYFSRQLNPDEIVAMFNIEMIGKPAVEGPDTAWITGFDRSDFGEILQQSVEGTPYRFYPDPYPDQNLFYRSDNATLARLGVPAHSISTTPIDVDKDYHQASDEVTTLDLDHMTNTIRAIARGAATIVSGEKTPTRVDTSQLR